MRIISLKWKALWGISLVLVIIIAVLSWLSYSKLVDQVRASQAVEEAVYLREIHALLKQVDNRLQQMVGWLPALEGMDRALEQEDPEALQRLFERHWPSAQLDYDLQSVSFFSRSGRRIGRWDDGSIPPAIPAEWVDRVTKDEQPMFALACSERCYQVGVLPLLVGDRTAGTLVLTSSVVELIVRFREVTGRDIGVLIRSSIRPASADVSLKRLPEWGMNVAALSDAPRRMPLLRLTAELHPQLAEAPGTLFRGAVRCHRSGGPGPPGRA